MTAQWNFTSDTVQRASDIQLFDGALSFTIHLNDVLGFAQFLRSLCPHNLKGDGFLRFFWQQAFNCAFSDLYEGNNSIAKFSGQENVETLFETSMMSESYSIYNAIYAIAMLCIRYTPPSQKSVQQLTEARV